MSTALHNLGSAVTTLSREKCIVLSLGGGHEWTKTTSKWDKSWGYESIVKKDLKELKVTIFTNKIYLVFDVSNVIKKFYIIKYA